MKNAIQRFGKFLSAMVMPNIGAFIAWGFITALFIPDGWFPNEGLASIHPFMLNYLLPMLIAYTGGKMVGGNRGGVMGAIAVMGCIAGAEQPMLMAAMIMGPVAGWLVNQFDKAVDGRIPAGFEMLVNNFSIGIFGMLLAIVGFLGIGPFMTTITGFLTAGVNILVTKGLLPLVAFLVEPAKVLFLNNAINHGIFTPIGAAQAEELGQSIMYMIEANPGPGLGVLLAYWFFSKNKQTKDSAPGAIIIHFFGGIHEIYFPYILMNPIVIIGPIVANICAIAFYSFMRCGLLGPASPGSFLAFMGMAPRNQILWVALGVVIATVVSFVISGFLIRMTEGKAGKSLESAKEQMSTMKAEAKGVGHVNHVKKIVFACDAGMGSSAMGATKFRNRIKKMRPDIVVKNTSVDHIPSDANIAVVQAVLQERAKTAAPHARIIVIHDFLADPKLDILYEELIRGENKAVVEVDDSETVKLDLGNSKDIFVKESVKLNQVSVTKEEAIRQAGNLLVQQGAVDISYVDAMLERERIMTTYIGMGVAIPHGTVEAKSLVRKTAITMVQYPNGIEFGNEKAYLVFGIAGIGDEHLDLLEKIAEALENADVLEKMKTTNDVEWILEQLS